VIVVIVMMVVVMVVYDHHNLGLRRIGRRQAEDESESKQNLFHVSVSRHAIWNTELL
jgi:hypothetical protein